MAEPGDIVSVRFRVLDIGSKEPEDPWVALEVLPNANHPEEFAKILVVRESSLKLEPA